MFFSNSLKKIEIFKKVPLFSVLHGRNLKEIVNIADEIQVKAGRFMVQEGRGGWHFYLIAEGQARVEKNGKKMRTLGPGEFFGEISLIDREPRTASVIAESDMTVLAVSSQYFAHLLETVPGLHKDMLIALCKYIRRADQPSIYS